MSHSCSRMLFHPSHPGYRRFLHTRALYSAFSLASLVILWLLFAPQQFGGETGYVIIHGRSMTPLFSEGGLVLVRQAAQYQVGDIVTYRYPSLGPVIHRIVGRDGSRYIMKGDANNWLDGYQPEASDIIGKYWFYLPGLGKFLMQLRSPGWMAILVGVGTVMFGISTTPQPKSRLGRLRGQASRFSLQFGHAIADWQEGYMYLAYSLGVLALVLGVFAFLRPLQTTKGNEAAYDQVGVYAYTSAVPEGIYDDNRLKSGEVIYPRVTCAVDLFFNYHLIGSQNMQAAGQYQLKATVSDARGWQRVLDLQPAGQFTGAAFQASGKLDICQIQKMISQVQSVTGVVSSSYQLAISPNIAVSGTVNGVSFQDQFDTPLVFNLEPDMVYLSSSQSDGSSEVLQPTKKGLAVSRQVIENTLPIFGLAIHVRLARWLSVMGLLAAGVLIGWGTYTFQQAERSDPRLLIQFLSGRQPVELSTQNELNGLLAGKTVAISQLPDLVRIANSLGTAVQVFETAGLAHYLVHDLNVVYYVQQLKELALEQAALPEEAMALQAEVGQAVMKTELNQEDEA